MDPNYQPFLLKSGRGVDDFGFWEDCRGLQNVEEYTSISAPRYDLFIFTIQGAVPLKWGLCYPEVCSQTIKTAIRSNIGSPFEF